MPRIIPNKTGGRIIFDEADWLAGLHPQYINSYSANKRMGNNLSFARAINPYRDLGCALPGFNPTDAANVSIVDAAIIAGVSKAESAYCVSAGAKMHKITLLTGALVNDAGGTGFPHTISGTTPVGSDCVVYYINVSSTPTPFLIYSYNNSSQGQLGRNNLGTTFIDDYLTNASYLNKTAMTGTTAAPVPHPLYVSQYDGNLYVGDGRFVHSLDGVGAADLGVWSEKVFTLPPGYIITSFAEVDGYLVIFAYYAPGVSGTADTYYKGKAKAFFWNYWDPKAEKIKNLNDNYVIGAFEYKGAIGCFTMGGSLDQMSNRLTKLQIFNGSEFDVVCSYIGNAPSNKGVEIIGEAIYWAGSDGNAISIFCWGSPYKGMPVGLNRLAEGLGNTPGMLRTFAGSMQLLSSGATTAGGLQLMNGNYYHQSGLSTCLAEPLFPLDMFGRVTRMTVRFAKTASGGRNVKFTLYNRAGASVNIEDDISNLTTITAANIIKKYFPVLNFEALHLAITWGSGSAATDAPAVASVEVEYQNIAF